MFLSAGFADLAFDLFLCWIMQKFDVKINSCASAHVTLFVPLSIVHVDAEIIYGYKRFVWNVDFLVAQRSSFDNNFEK
jgi:hypothetical protein